MDLFGRKGGKGHLTEDDLKTRLDTLQTKIAEKQTELAEISGMLADVRKEYSQAVTDLMAVKKEANCKKAELATAHIEHDPKKHAGKVTGRMTKVESVKDELARIKKETEKATAEYARIKDMISEERKKLQQAGTHAKDSKEYVLSRAEYMLSQGGGPSNITEAASAIVWDTRAKLRIAEEKLESVRAELAAERQKAAKGSRSQKSSS